MGGLLIVVKVNRGFAIVVVVNRGCVSVVADLFRMVAVDYSMVFDPLKLSLKLG